MKAMLQAVLLAWLVGGSFTPLQGQSSNQQVLEKLREIERRLELLEQQQKLPEVTGQEVPGKQTVEVQALKQQVDVLAEELEKLRSGEQEEVVTEDQAKSLGLGSSAASVYRKKQGVSLAGYGEMLYQNFGAENQRGDSTNQGARLDFLRAIVYAGYRFNDKFVFNSEVEFEHATTDKGGSASVEFAYIDYLVSQRLSLRGGLLLVPMGLTNELHEPTAFLGARRSETETRIIPSTWRENGFGIVGSTGMFDYRAYVINGLDATGFGASGLRGGRQKGARTRSKDLAFVGRLDVNPTPGVFFGGSLYRGGSGQGQVVVEGAEYDLTTTIGEAHAQIHLRGVDVRALFARATLDDAVQLNRHLGLTGTSSVAEEMTGGFLQFGYNILNEFREGASLMPYLRYEKVNTQHSLAPGFTLSPAHEGDFLTLGLELKPIHNIVLKSDFQWIQNGNRTGVNQFNIVLGYAF